MKVKVWSIEDEENIWDPLFEDQLGLGKEEAQKLSEEVPYLLYGLFDDEDGPPRSMFLNGVEYVRIW